jgi:apolipoprotein N-acyltransferase
MRRIAALLRAGALPALGGLMAAAGQAPLGLWPLALAGYALALCQVAGAEGARARVGRAWAAGAGHFAGALFWIVEPFLVEPARDGWMAPFALVLMAGGMALFWALAGALAGLGRTRAGRVAGFALGLASTDLLRSYVLTGFPWALAGHVWIDTPVAQAAAFVGPVGLSLLTVALAGLPVLAASGRGRGAGALVACALLGAVWAGGAVRLAAPETRRAEPVRVRLVQPNATQRLKWEPGMWEVFIGRQMQASAAPAEAPLDLIVWPETAVPYLLDDAGPLIEAALTRSGGVPIALGIQRAEGPRYFNSLAATDASGDIIAVYDKFHLVPFGEYMPFGDLAARFGLSAFAAQAGFGYSAGPGAAVIDLGRAGRVLPLICYEAVFAQGLRAAPERADWILQVTNDGWFGNVSGPYQHLAQARLRAIEQGLPLLRAANTGVTAAFDARGRPLASLPLDTEGWLDIDVPGALAPTPYARAGDGPIALLLLAAILSMGVRRRAGVN